MTNDALVLRVHRMCQTVRDCRDEAAIAAVIGDLLNVLGGDHWVYVTFMRDDESSESYRFLFGCPPAWCQEYASQRWFVNDPLLLYAQGNHSPEVVSNIPTHTSGQQALLERAKDYGFSDGFVVPAHSASHARVGALYIAFKDPTRLPREIFEAVRPILRTFSGEVLDWMLCRIRLELIASTRLTEREIELLRYEAEGFTTKEIARIETSAEKAINRQFGNILFKLGVSSRSEAASIAKANGLF